MAGSDDTEEKYFTNTMQTMTKAMIDDGVIVVVTAGNEAAKGRPNVDGYPALFADELPLIVVGSTDNRGNKSPFSQGGPLVTVSAIGEDVECPQGTGTSQSWEDGTSFSAPAVAGLAANLLSDPKYQSQLAQGGRSALAGNMKKLIQSLAYPQGKPSDPPSAWNGVDWIEEFNAGCGPDSILDRRATCGTLYLLHPRFLARSVLTNDGRFHLHQRLSHTI